MPYFAFSHESKSTTGYFTARACEADHGDGNCEQCLALFYPRCPEGYSPFGCNICRPALPDCAEEGYNSPGIGLSCPIRIELGNVTTPACRNGLEQNGLYAMNRAKMGSMGLVLFAGKSVTKTSSIAGQAALGAGILQGPTAPLPSSIR